MSIDALTEMSNRYGSNEDYVLAGGGNTSYKENKVMYVKGSGTSLATIAADEFVAMDLVQLRDSLSFKYPQDMSAEEIEDRSFAKIMAAKLLGQGNKNPSVESILHALFPYDFVLHIHPALINGFTCSIDYEAAIYAESEQTGCCDCVSRSTHIAQKKLFGKNERVQAVCVGLMPPGPGLARLCNGVLKQAEERTGKFPRIAFLQNHGIFVAADTVGEIDDLMTYVEDTLTSVVKEYPDFTDTAYDAEKIKSITGELQKHYPDDSEILFSTNEAIESFVESVGVFAPLKRPLTQEQVICYGDEAAFIEDNSKRQRDGSSVLLPRVVAVQGLGFFAIGNNKIKANDVRMSFENAVKIAVYAKSFGGVNPLSDEAVNIFLTFNPYARLK